MGSILVVHLLYSEPVRRAELAARFDASYAKHPAGCPHELLHVMQSNVLDIREYVTIAGQSSPDVLVRLNAYTTLLADGWLAKLTTALELPDVGAAGPGGSWESGIQGFFPPFPNPHLRSSAFAIRRSTLLQVAPAPERITSKLDCHLFESGYSGMTRFLSVLGLWTVVVRKDGAVWEADQWPASRTYCRGEEENRMISDRQTEEYASLDLRGRAECEGRTWGVGAPA